MVENLFAENIDFSDKDSIIAHFQKCDHPSMEISGEAHNEQKPNFCAINLYQTGTAESNQSDIGEKEAIILKQETTEDEAKDNNISEKHSSKEDTAFSEDISTSENTKFEDIPKDLASTITNICDNLRLKQEQIDDGSYVKTGPGRNRKNPPKTSDQLREMIINYLRASFTKIVSNKRCKNRKDALITIYIRALKKLSYHLVEKCAAKNMYKRNEMSKFLIAFSEAYNSFLFAIKNDYETNMLETFVEFVVIYFPVDKVRALINNLIKQNV